MDCAGCRGCKDYLCTNFDFIRTKTRRAADSGAEQNESFKFEEEIIPPALVPGDTVKRRILFIIPGALQHRLRDRLDGEEQLHQRDGL